MPEKFLVIRADATPKTGVGHVFRCIALAQAWKRKGGLVYFIGHFSTAAQQRLASEGFIFITLQGTTGTAEDALETIAACYNVSAKLTVLDGYSFSQTYIQTIRSSGIKLAYYDDYNHLENYDVDFLINQNVGSETIKYNTALTATKLCGSKYTMIRDEFLRIPRPQQDFSKSATRVLLTLGGADPENITLSLLKAITFWNKNKISVTVAIGPANPHSKELSLFTKEHCGANITLVINGAMPELMRATDVSISAAGSTAWELAYMGVPTMLVVTAENQQGVARALIEAGAAMLLCSTPLPPATEITQAFTHFLEDRDTQKRLSHNSLALIDGKGADRIVEVLMRL